MLFPVGPQWMVSLGHGLSLSGSLALMVGGFVAFCLASVVNSEHFLIKRSGCVSLDPEEFFANAEQYQREKKDVNWSDLVTTCETLSDCYKKTWTPMPEEILADPTLNDADRELLECYKS